MSVKITSNEEFQASNDGLRQLVVVANGGSATLQAKGGSNWVTVTDGVISADGITTFYAVSAQVFRVTLAGGAEAWLSG